MKKYLVLFFVCFFSLSSYSSNLKQFFSWGGSGGGGEADKSGKIYFIGATTSIYNGNLGGLLGANQKCEDDYPGTYFCTDLDLLRAGTKEISTAAMWIHQAGAVNSDSITYRLFSNCENWSTNNSSYKGYSVTGSGTNLSNCNQTYPLACCSQEYIEVVDAGYLLYVGASHTPEECTGAGGTVVTITGDPNGTQVCRFNAANCPAGWSQAGNWSTAATANTNWTQTAQSARTITCNGVSVSYPAISASSGTITSEGHSWSNSSIGTTSCRAPRTNDLTTNNSCNNETITQSFTSSNSYGWCASMTFPSTQYFRNASNSTVYQITTTSFSTTFSATPTRTQIGCM